MKFTAQILPWLLASLASAEYAPVNDTECDCFQTDGSSEAYFANHRFFDFRSLSQYAGVPDIVSEKDDTASAPFTSDYFTTSDFTDTWEIDTRNNSGALEGTNANRRLLRIYSPSNVYIQRSSPDDASGSDTFLTLRTSRLEDFQTAGEIKTTSSKYQYFSARMYARTVGASGACTAMFTYLDGARVLSEVQESDIEFLTRGPRDTVQYTNQPSETDRGEKVKGSTMNVTMPGGVMMGDWAVHRMDWTEGRTTWYVDGEEAATTDFQVPTDPTRLLLNAWSDGATWTGRMDVGGQAFLQIQWIELAFNSTEPEDGDSGGEKRLRRRADANCGAVCSIDETDEVGTVVMKAVNAGARFSDGGRLSMVALFTAWAVATCI